MSAGFQSARRPCDVAALLVFVAAIAAPGVDRVVRPDEERDVRAENREPAPFPAFPVDARAACGWPRGFDRWFDDTSGLRDVLLAARNGALLAARVAPTPLLDVGRDDWIFFRGDMALEAHRGTSKLLADRWDLWADALEERRARLAQRGVRFVFAIVPDKETIYPERLPDAWRPVGPGAADGILDVLRRRTSVDVVDLRPALRAATSADRPEVEDHVYFPRGTHWTFRGACAANSALVAHLSAWLPGMRAPDCAALEPRRGSPEGEDSWMRNLYLPNALRPSWAFAPEGTAMHAVGVPPPARGTSTLAGTGDPGAPTVHLLHDSHGPFLHPFLAASCRRLRASWQSFVDESVIEVERPDVVVLLRAERMLSLPPDPDVWTNPGEGAARLPSASAIWRLETGWRRVEIVGAGRLEAADESVVWTAESWTDRFLIDLEGAAPRTARLAVVLDVEHEIEHEIEHGAPGKLDLVSGAPAGDEWAGARNVPVSLSAGRNREAVVLAEGESSGRILVRIGPAGRWRFRRLEVHELPRPVRRP